MGSDIPGLCFLAVTEVGRDPGIPQAGRSSRRKRNDCGIL